MQLPEWFEEELARDSGGRFRVRWSPGRSRWQVEERIGRQKRKRAMTWIKSNLQDEAIREQEGYRLLFELTPGSKTRCPRCTADLKLTPALRPRTTKCQACKKEWKFCFMPAWGDVLVHLRYIQPERGGYERVGPEADANEVQRAQGMRRERHNHTEAIWKEDFTQNFEIDSVGYGSHSGTRTWK